MLYEDTVCRGCGNSKILTLDKDNIYTPAEDMCEVCVGQDIHARVLHQQEEEADKKYGEKGRPPAQRRPSDGRSIYMRLLTDPDEIESARAAVRRQQARTQKPPTHPAG